MIPRALRWVAATTMAVALAACNGGGSESVSSTSQDLLKEAGLLDDGGGSGSSSSSGGGSSSGSGGGSSGVLDAAAVDVTIDDGDDGGGGSSGGGSSGGGSGGNSGGSSGGGSTSSSSGGSSGGSSSGSGSSGASSSSSSSGGDDAAADAGDDSSFEAGDDSGFDSGFDAGDDSGDASCTPSICPLDYEWCWQPVSGPPAQCVLALACDPSDVITEDGCTCCPQGDVQVDLNGFSYCLSCQSLQNVFDQYCANNDPPASCTCGAQSCGTGQRWCTNSEGDASTGQCVDEPDCDGGACSCSVTAETDDFTLTGCTAPDPCPNDDPPPGCATCCATCLASSFGSIGVNQAQDLQPLVQWDEDQNDCVDAVTRQPTANRNPTPGPCGTLTGDHEAFIQSIADIIMMGDTWQQDDVRQLLDFHGRSLPGMVFHGEFAAINLEGADLRKADLSDASFFAANMRGVDLRWSNAKGVSLVGADLSLSRLADAPRKMTLTYKADFTGANLSLSRFDGAYLVQTIFNGVDAPSAVFDGAYAPCADFTNAKLANASFVGFNLTKFANDTCTGSLAGADLRMTDWRGASVNLPDRSAGRADLSYSVWCGASASDGPFAQSTEYGSFVQNAAFAKAQRDRGVLFVPADRCGKFTPSTSLKYDQRVAKAMALADGSGRLQDIYFYDWSSWPSWEEDGTRPTDGYNPDLNRDSPGWPLLENGTLINIARQNRDGLPERGIIYLLRMGSSFVVYTSKTFPNGSTDRRTPGNGSGQVWWERRVSAKGRASMLSNPEIISQAFYYDQRDISDLQNLAFGLELTTNVLTLVPGIGTWKIVLENVLYGKPIWSTQNIATMAIDASAFATFGASKLAALPKLAQTAQALRVGAVVTLAAGAGLQTYNAYDNAVKQNYLGAAVDVGSVVISGLLIRKNIKDFYQTRTFLQKMADYAPPDFPASPLKLTGNAEKDKAVNAFGQWMAERSTGAQMDIAALQNPKGAQVTGDALAGVSDGISNLRYQKAVDMAMKSGNAGAIADAKNFGKKLSDFSGADGNWDPWGITNEASFAAGQKAARKEIGDIISKRLNGADTLTNEWQTLGGDKVKGVRLYGGDTGQQLYNAMWGKPNAFKPAFLTQTSGPATADKIFQDGMARWARVLNGAEKGDAALGQFAQGLQAYYQGLRYARGGDAIGRVLGSAVFRKAFGRRIQLPPLVDGYAYAMDQCQFTEWLVPILKKALQ